MGTIQHTILCSDCPELERRLHGLSKEESTGGLSIKGGLCCGNCGTTLEALRTGHLLGCSECYVLFGEAIRQELLRGKKIPPRLAVGKPGEVMHIGRIPTKKQTLSPTMQLLALNEALNETLEKEDYEQAALIRDKIRTLTEFKKGESDV